MFKVVITEKEAIMTGTNEQILKGLLYYIDVLKEIGIPEKIIKEVIDIKFLEDNNNLRMLNLNKKTKQEVEEILEKEIINKIFD